MSGIGIGRVLVGRSGNRQSRNGPPQKTMRCSLNALSRAPASLASWSETITFCLATLFFSLVHQHTPRQVSMSLLHSAAECGSLRVLFPQAPPDPVPLLVDTPEALVLQSSPTLFVLLVWFTVEARGLRRPATRQFRRTSTLLALASTAAIAVLAWRTFELLGCEGRSEVEQWSILTVTTGSIANLFLVVLAMPRFPRGVLLIFCALGATSVALDWMLRGGVLVSQASHLLVAVQQCYGILVVCALYHVQPRRHPTLRGDPRLTRQRPPMAPALGSVDPLARNDAYLVDMQDGGASGYRLRSWFAV